MASSLALDFLADINLTPSEEVVMAKVYALREHGYRITLRALAPDGGVRLRYGIAGPQVASWKHDRDVHAALDSLLHPITFFSSGEGRPGWEAHLEYEGTCTARLGIEQTNE